MAGAPTRPARICVAGAGIMGRWHAHAAERLGAEVSAVVDVAPAAAARLASRHRSVPYPDLDSALRSSPVDVVHVCTPLETHAALVEVALAHGCHALVEKPLASTLAETTTVLGLARGRGLLVNPVHQLPFQPGFLRLLEQRERLGDLVRVTYRTCSAGGEGRSSGERRRLLLEILPHPLSLFYRLLGDAWERAELAVARYTADDLDLVGRLGETRLDVSVSLRGRPTRNELEVVGTRATAFADLFHGYGLVEGGRVSRPAKIVRPLRLGSQLFTRAGVNLAGRALRREPAYPGLRELVGRFHEAALSGGEPPVSDSEALAVACVLDDVRERGGS